MFRVGLKVSHFYLNQQIKSVLCFLSEQASRHWKNLENPRRTCRSFVLLISETCLKSKTSWEMFDLYNLKIGRWCIAKVKVSWETHAYNTIVVFSE